MYRLYFVKQIINDSEEQNLNVEAKDTINILHLKNVPYILLNIALLLLNRNWKMAHNCYN